MTEVTYWVVETQPGRFPGWFPPPVGLPRTKFIELRLISVKRSAGDQIENCMDSIARMRCPKTA
jgi:hypothetical protein